MSALNQDGCFASESFYSTSCGLPGDLFYGCFSPDPCISATSAAAASGEQCFTFRPRQDIRVLFCKEVTLKNTKRVPQLACPSGYSFSNTTCGDTDYLEGCVSEEAYDRLSDVKSSIRL